jgi:hypothetical protein
MRVYIVFLVFLISGCSSITKNMEIATEGTPQTDVVIFRPSAFAAGSNDMLIGFDDKYFGAIRNNQFMKVKINSGTYNFQVKANGSPASRLMVTLKPNEKVCFVSSINSAVVGVAIIPLVANLVSWFKLSEVSCPEEQFFQEYSEVKKS